MPLSWKTGVQRQIKITNSQGEVVDAMEIPVLISDGSTFKINVPVDMYNELRITQLIEARMQEHVAVATLTGTVE